MVPPRENVHEVIRTLRSVRHYKPDPVDPALLRRVIEAATYAPNSTNRQLWRFLVVTDAATRARIAAIYADAFFKDRDRGPLSTYLADPVLGPVYREAIYLAERFGEVPVHIVVTQAFPDSPGASIYPACQNLMLEAWSLGLGTILTTVWRRREAELRDLLGIPDEYQPEALIALGWPARAYGPPRRRPVEEVTFLDHWGRPFPPVDQARP